MHSQDLVFLKYTSLSCKLELSQSSVIETALAKVFHATFYSVISIIIHN